MIKFIKRLILLGIILLVGLGALIKFQGKIVDKAKKLNPTLGQYLEKGLNLLNKHTAKLRSQAMKKVNEKKKELTEVAMKEIEKLKVTAMKEIEKQIPKEHLAKAKEMMKNAKGIMDPNGVKCLMNKIQIKSVVSLHSATSGEPLTSSNFDIKKLIKENYFKKPPICPSKGNYIMNKAFEIQCTVHKEEKK